MQKQSGPRNNQVEPPRHRRDRRFGVHCPACPTAFESTEYRQCRCLALSGRIRPRCLFQVPTSGATVSLLYSIRSTSSRRLDPGFPEKAVLHTRLEPGSSPHRLCFPLIDFQIQTEDAGLFHRTCINPLAILPHKVRSAVRFVAKRPIRKPQHPLGHTWGPSAGRKSKFAAGVSP